MALPRTISRDASPLSFINPMERHAYIDRIDLWLKEPITHADRKWLKGECGHVYGRRNLRKLFYPQLQYRLSLTQPSAAAILFLAKYPEARLSVVEVALDLIVENEEDCELGREAINRYFVKRNHRTQDGFAGDTKYSGPRWSSRTVYVTYSDKPCKITGGNCIHIECRMYGAETLKRAGVRHPTDLLTLNLRKFWKDKLLFFVLNHEKFGRKCWNRYLRTRRRLSWILRIPLKSGVFEYNRDTRISQTIFRSYRSMQEMWDEFGKLWGTLRPYVKQVVVDDLLPENRLLVQLPMRVRPKMRA